MSRWSDKDDKSSLEAAAEAAAKVNAMLIAKGALKPSQLSQQRPSKQNVISTTGNMAVAEVEINDVPIGCRNMLTRGSTQEEISKASSAGVSTRGRYLSPQERSQVGAGDRPLYLCVQGPTKESVDIAVHRINEIITNYKNKGTRFSPANLPPQRPPMHGPNPADMGPRHAVPPQFIAQPPVMPQPQTVTVLQDKLYIGLEHAPPSFGVKEKMLGPEGSYLQHIQVETGAKVILRGKGSGFLDFNSQGRESLEPMHVFLEHPSPVILGQAKQLAENLIQTVQQDYAQFQQALAAMPSGAATLLAGLSQQTSLPGTLINPVPTMAPPPMAQQFSSPGSTTRIMVPTSLGTPVQNMQEMMTMSAPSAVLTAPPPLLMQAPTGPPPQILGPPHLGPDVNPLVNTMQPEVQIVTQSTLVPVSSSWGPPPSSVQMNATSTPPVMPASSVIYTSPVVSTTYTYHPPTRDTYHPPTREEHKRRFTEEKLEEKVPENLLGYEHGPPHLANLVVQGPPQDGQNSAPKLPPPHQSQVSEMFSGTQIVSSSSQPVYTTSLVPMPSDDRGSPFTRYTTTEHTGDSSDKQLMPPPPLPASLKRSSFEKPGGGDRKKSKGSEYGDEEDEEDKQRGRGKYQYNQYSNAPQLYTQTEPDHFTDQRPPDSEQGYQFQISQQQPITEQYQFSPNQQPGTVTHILPPPPSSPGPPTIISTLPSHLYSQQPMYSISPSQSPPHPYTQDAMPSSGQQFTTVPHTITITGPPPPQSTDHILQPPPEQRLQQEEIPPPPMEQMQAPQGYSNMPPPISSGQYFSPQSMPLMAPPTQPPVSYAPPPPQVQQQMQAPQQPPNYPPPPPPGLPYYITN